MNLLLLLSALLSAFTGVAGGARAVERAATVTERIVPARLVSPAAVSPQRPAGSLPNRVTVSVAPRPLAPEPRSAVLLFLPRRRE